MVPTVIRPAPGTLAALLAPALAALAVACPAPAAAATLLITRAACVPSDLCQAKPSYVPSSGKLLLKGTGLQRGQLVLFPRKSNKKRLITSKLRKSRQGLI